MSAKVDAGRRNLTPREYAERIGVSVNTVLAWIKTGELRAINVGGRASKRPRYRISPEAVEQFELSRSVIPALAESATRRLRRAALGGKDYFPGA